MSPNHDQAESGRENLVRALAALPTHTPDDAAAWRHISAQLNIQQAVDCLPEHEPEPVLWIRISSLLDQAEAQPSALTQLPQHTPDDALWATIAARLDAHNPPAPRPWRLRAARFARRPVLAIVALLVLLTGGLWRWPLRPAAPLASTPHETISYGVEVVSEALPVAVSPDFAPDALGLRGEAFIDAHCSALPAVCHSERFRELRGQLDELTQEEARLANDFRRFGSQPELLRHQSRVTTQKAATTRELIQLLIS